MRSSSRRLAAFAASMAAAGLAAAAPAVAAPPPSQADLGKKPDFRLTLLHNNDGESKLATGSSVAGYGGAARFETVVERLRAEAAVAPVGPESRAKPKATGTLLVSSGDNFLAGLALLLGFQEGPPWPDAVVANALGYDAMTIGNHEFDFGQVRLAEFIEGIDDDIPFISANLGFEGTLLEELADAGRIAPAAVVERDGERVGIIGLTTPDVTAISSPGNVTVDSDLATVVNLLERPYSALPMIDGRFGHLAGLRVVVDPARTAQTVNVGPPVTIATQGERVRDVWLTNGTPQNTADDTQIVAGGAVATGCAPIDLATTDFTAKDGDAYPFTAQGLTFTPVGALYNQAFEDYIVAPAAQGGLGGTVTAARYPELPSGVRRITILGD